MLTTRPIVGRPRLDTVHSYQGYGGCPSRCRVRIWDRGSVRVVMLSELRDNPGTSVTNAAETLATELAWEHGLHPLNTLWLEHWPAHDFCGDPCEESFALLSFAVGEERGPYGGRRATFSRPGWEPLSRRDVETVVGHPWAPECYP